MRQISAVVVKMSVKYFCDSVEKWIKGFPILSSLVDDESFVNRYWDVAQNSWKKASSNEILLRFSVLVYQLMQEQQRYLSHIGIDFSQATQKLLRFIKECLLGDKDAVCVQKVGEYKSSNELFTTFISVVRYLSTVYIKNEGDVNIYFACSNAWTFMKDKFCQAQSRCKVASCNAQTKIQNLGKAAKDLLCSQINQLTLNFMENAERILFAMFDVCNNNELLQVSWSTSPKVSYLVAYILEFAEQFLDYISSLAAFDIEIELELGWIDMDADFVAMDIMPTRMKRRQVGQH